MILAMSCSLEGEVPNRSFTNVVRSMADKKGDTMDLGRGSDDGVADDSADGEGDEDGLRGKGVQMTSPKSLMLVLLMRSIRHTNDGRYLVSEDTPVPPLTFPVGDDDTDREGDD